MERLDSYPLTPILQKLLFYRFAILEIQPGEIAPLQEWGMPFVQKLQVQGAWAEVLCEALPFNSLSDATVISPSLAALLRVRHQQPYRPLVLCRPLFAAEFTSERLRPLVRQNLMLARMLAPDDAMRPLRWSASLPSNWGRQLEVWEDAHPMCKFKQLMCARNPDSDFAFREDGRLLEQLNLFGSCRPLSMDPELKSELLAMEDRFQGELKGSSGCQLVFARQRERLDWFKRDCLRLLPRRIQCIRFPGFPDARDPLPYFILVHDAAVRMARLPPHLRCLHLDGKLHDLRYRSARASTGAPGWLSLSTASITRYPSDYGIMRFICEDGEWYCYTGEQEGPADVARDFQHLLKVHRVLFQRGLGSTVALKRDSVF